MSDNVETIGSAVEDMEPVTMVSEEVPVDESAVVVIALNPDAPRPLVPTHPIEDDDLQQAYDAIYDVVDDITKSGGVNANNIAYIIKAVMETIDAVGKFAQWEGQTKEDKALELIEHVLEDLHKKKKIDDRLYADLTMALGYLAPAMFLLAILADKGKVLLQGAASSIERSCMRCKNRRSEQRLLTSAEKERVKNLRGIARGKLQARGIPNRR